MLLGLMKFNLRCGIFVQLYNCTVSRNRGSANLMLFRYNCLGSLWSYLYQREGRGIIEDGMNESLVCPGMAESELTTLNGPLPIVHWIVQGWRRVESK